MQGYPHQCLIANSRVNGDFLNKMKGIASRSFHCLMYPYPSGDTGHISSICENAGPANVFVAITNYDKDTERCRRFFKQVREIHGSAFGIVATGDLDLYQNSEIRKSLMNVDYGWKSSPDMITNSETEIIKALNDLLVGCLYEHRIPTPILQNETHQLLLLGNIHAMKAYGKFRMLEACASSTYFVTCSSSIIEWQDELLNMKEVIPKKTTDGNSAQLLSCIERFLYLLPDLVQRIDKQLFVKEKHVLVHSEWGYNRSVSVIFGYIMWKNRCNYDQAKEYLQTVQCWVHEPTHPAKGNTAYIRGLQLWYQLLQQTNYNLCEASSIVMAFVKQNLFHIF